jgi:hypothetical protein
MANEMRDLLESVAMECLNQPQEPASGYLRDVQSVLTRRLLPLLEAGATYRKMHGNSPARNWRAIEYDAAKRKAMEGK